MAGKDDHDHADEQTDNERELIAPGAKSGDPDAEPEEGASTSGMSPDLAGALDPDDESAE